jgi:hypothetical protein
MLKREPLAIRTGIVALIAAALHLGVLLNVVPIDQDTEKALVALIDAGAALIVILTVRPKVTPLVDPRSSTGDRLVPENPMESTASEDTPSALGDASRN